MLRKSQLSQFTLTYINSWKQILYFIKFGVKMVTLVGIAYATIRCKAGTMLLCVNLF
jgi:hypothetical protein